ncbi:MAG TPA: fumarate/nitrate reduction transcriptional regulator Fnr [Burkholderiales bacterium]|jgi:CRP/FNR family transcriptional regulator|nr:fumarate/nitrate reduction transcriptional regulator Fnr [Burkholderiales bacterium]
MTPHSGLSSVDVNRLKAACSTCSLRELCLPAGLDTRELERVDRMVNRRRPVRRGDYLYRSGTQLESLYAIRTGFMKSCVLHDDGREQVAGFHMMGDLMGLDAISTGRHMCDVVALEDTEVCDIPLARLEQLSRDIPSLQQHFHRIMSREIVRDHGVMLLLGTMRAEERLAAFLLNLSQRFAARGYSSNEFYLRMTREEIGSYLGLKLETISRALSRFHEEQLIEVHTKYVRILDMDTLRRMVGVPVS